MKSRNRLVVLLLTTSFAWLMVMPLIAATPCGLRIPHEHILLGHIDPAQMRMHLAQETNCRGSGQRPNPGQQGTILSYGAAHSLTFSTVTLILWIPALISLVFAGMSGRLSLQILLPEGIVFPPLAPPPEPMLFE